MDLSIIIPALDEENKIGDDIYYADEFLKGSNIDGEIIIVDDGSSDNTSQIVADKIKSDNLNCTLLKSETNQGKGSAVRKGILASKGRLVLYADAGHTVPFSYSVTGIEMIKSGSCSMAFGSRKHQDSKITRPQDWDRKAASSILSKVFRTLFPIPNTLTDTQCGFKVYDGDIARKLFSESTINGFLFEIEIIILAVQQGLKINEFPVEWRCDRDSRLSFTGSSLPIIKEVYQLRSRYKKGS